MEKQASSKNIMLSYGLVLGIVSILISVVSYALGMHLDRDWKFGVVGFLAMIVIISIGIKKFKEENHNLLSFGQAVKIGVGISIISALLVIIYNLIFMNFIEPDYMNQLLEIERAKWLENPDMTAENIEAAEGMFKTFSSPAITSAISIVGSAFFGFIISAIAGAIMKRSEEDGY
jgi:hypothetical protein